MKKYILIFAFLYLLLPKLYSQCNFKNIAHRGGASYNFPENSLLSLEQAYIDGSWANEVDIRKTSDSVLVLCHDEYVDRISNGHGFVADFTLADLKKLDIGSWKNPRFAGTRMPTMLEAIAVAQKYNRRLYLNMKVFEPELICKTLKQSGAKPDAVMLDPDDTSKVRIYHALMPQTPLVYFGDPPDSISDTTFYKFLINNNVIAAEVPANTALYASTKNKIAQYRNMLHKFNLELWGYTINDNEQLDSLKLFGMDGLETDRASAAKLIFCENKNTGFFPEKRITGQWDFNNKNLIGTIGSQMVEVGDTNISDQKIIFGKTSDFNIPNINGKDAEVMMVPAYDSAHRLEFFSNIFPQGNPDHWLSCDEDYTIIMDILKLASSNSYIALFQTSNQNADDADLFIKHKNGINSLGILSQYFGNFADSTWYRLAFVFDLKNLNIKEYIDGNLAGTIIIPDYLKERFCINNNWGIQPSNFFSDNDEETANIFTSSLQIRDYPMSAEEITMLGKADENKIPSAIKIDSSMCLNNTIILQDISVCEGNPAELIADAGDSLNYHWQTNKYQGAGWEDIYSNIFSGTASSKLTINSVDSSLNMQAFRCRISNDCAVFSDEGNLKVNKNPIAFLDIKSNTKLCYSDSLKITIKTENALSNFLIYNNTSIPVLNNTDYYLKNSGTYYLKAVNTCSSDSTSSNILSIIPPLILKYTKSIIANESFPVDISVDANENDIIYQWQTYDKNSWKNASLVYPLLKSDSSVLHFKTTTTELDQKSFRCIVKRAICNDSTSTDPILFTVLIPQNISDLNNQQEIAIYPNPSNGNFILKTKNIVNSIEIYSIDGIKIFEKNIKNYSQSEYNFNMQLPSGIYQIIINSISGRIIKKISIL